MPYYTDPIGLHGKTSSTDVLCGTVETLCRFLMKKEQIILFCVPTAFFLFAMILKEVLSIVILYSIVSKFIILVS